MERIKQGLENKRAIDPTWTPKGKHRDQELWTKVEALMVKHSSMSAEDVAKLADCGVATVYRIKRAMKDAV
ncbi:hypothetical protein D3C76_1838990 [compost metagenome]